MKRKKVESIAVVIVFMVTFLNLYVTLSRKFDLADLTLADIEVLAQSEGGNYSCTVTVDCGYPLSGSVSCTGKECSRGLDWEKGAYVECDNKRTYCYAEK